MSGVLRVPRLQRLLGADVNGDGNDRQDADVPEGKMVVKRIVVLPQEGLDTKLVVCLCRLNQVMVA